MGGGEAFIKRNEGKNDFLCPSFRVETVLNCYVPELINYSQALGSLYDRDIMCRHVVGGKKRQET